MNQLPVPSVPGDSDSERFQHAVNKILNVSKTAILKEEAKWKRAKDRKKRAKQ